jgi:hypothetical protein
MKPVLIAGLTVLSAALFCTMGAGAIAGAAQSSTELTVTVLGIVVEKPEGGYQFIDLAKDVIVGLPPQDPIKANTKIWSQYVTKLQISYQGQGSQILFGPNSGTNEFAAIKVENSEPVVHVTSGFVYTSRDVSRDWPTLKTDRVEATAEGSKLIMQVCKAENQHRAYFVDGTKATATIGSTPPSSTTKHDQFIAVMENSVHDGWKNILDDSFEAQFRDAVLDMAKAAGM